MGHYCRICHRSRPNERFNGGGHRIHVCRECRRLPIEKRHAIEAADEIEGFLFRQSRISPKNVARLTELATSKDPGVAAKAKVMLQVARAAPGKRRRLRRIRSSNPELLRQMVAAGLLTERAEASDEWIDTMPPEGEEPFLEDEEPCEDDEDLPF